MARTNETLGELQPNERNPRRMSDVQREALRKSLAEFGPLDGFIFNRRSKSLVGGHQRKSVLADESKIVILERLTKPNAQGTTARGYVEANGERITYREVDWKPAKEKAGMIAANKHSGEWNETELARILSELQTEDFDLDLTGFDEAEIGDLLEVTKSEVDAEPQIDKAAELAAKWKVERGQIWELGNHRLMCGDSTKIEDVSLLEIRSLLMVTDPPYGVEYEPEWRKEAGVRNCDNNSTGKVVNDNRSDWTQAWKLFRGDVAYIWHAGKFSPAIAAGLNECDFDLRCLIVWAKEQGVLSRGHYHHQHEPCWYAVKKGKTAHWRGDRTQTTLWQINKSNRRDTGHSTQKPIECMARPIRNNSRRGEEVYDPFVGSGTTIIACEQLGRKCRAMEIDPGYVAVAIQRWVDATGKTPVKGGGPP